MLRLHRHYYDDSGSNSSPKQNEADSVGGGAATDNFQRMDMHQYNTNRNNNNSSRRRRYSSHDESNGESSSISSMGRGEPTSLNRRVSGESVQTAPATLATNKPSTNIYQMVQSTTTPEQQRQKPSPSSSRKNRISPTRERRSSSNTNYQQQQQHQQYWNSGTSNSGHMSTTARSQDKDGDDRILQRRRIPSKVVQHDRSNTTIDTAALTNSSRSGSFALHDSSSRSFQVSSPTKQKEASNKASNTTIDTAALTNSSRSGSFALHGSSSRSFQVSPTKQDEINQLLSTNNTTIIDTAATTSGTRSNPLNNSLRSSASSQQKRRTSFNSVRSSREEDDNVSSKPPPLPQQQQRQTSTGEKSNTNMTDGSSGHMSHSSHNNMSHSSHNITQSSSQDETNVMSNLDEEKYLQEERQRRRQILRGNLDTQEQIQKQTKTTTSSSSLSSYYVNQEKSGKKLLLSGGRRRNDITEKARRMSGGSEKRMILQEEQQLAYSGRQQQGLEERVVYPGAVHVIPDADDDPAIYPGAVRVGSNRRLMNPYEKDIDNDDNDDDEDNKTVQGGSSLSSRHNRRMFQMQDSIHEDDENNGSDRRGDMRRIPSSSTMSSLTTTRSAAMGMNSMSFASRSLRTNSRSSSHPNNYNNDNRNDDDNDCNNPNRYPNMMDMTDINPENSNARGRKSKLESFRKQWIVLLTLVMVAIGIGLTVGFVSNNKKDDTNTNTNNPKKAGEDIPERWNDDNTNNVDENNNDESSSSWTSSSFLPWKKVGNDIIMEETLPADGYTQRYTVAMSDDGKIVAIGSPYSDSFQKTDTLFKAGIVRVYAFDDEEKFQQLGTDLSGYESNDWFGSSVALSADGTTLAVSAKHSSQGGIHTGQVRIFRWNEEDWFETNVINGDESNSIFGHSISLSEDGTILAIGAPYNEGGVSGSDTNYNNEKSPGRVRIYEYTKKPAEEEDDDEYSWIQRGSDLVGETSGEEFGTSVSLSKDGTVLVVGSPKYDQKGKYNDVVEEAGRAYVYHWNLEDEEYERFDDTIDGNNLRSRGDLLGDSVYISGSILAVGAPTKDNIGYVRTYDVDISTNSTQIEEEENRIRVESSKAIMGPKISVQALSNDGSTMGITIDENNKNQVRGNGENTLGNTVLIYKCDNSTTNDNNQIWTIKGSQSNIVVNGVSSSIESKDNTIKTTSPKIPGYAIAMNHNGNRIVVASWYRCNNTTNDNKKNNKCTKYPVITVYEWS